MATRAFISFSLLLLLLFFHFSAASPRKLIQVQAPSTVLNYHNGPLLKGNYTLNLLFYGAFSPSQRSVVVDFVRSISSGGTTVSEWWATTSKYTAGSTHIALGRQLIDSSYTLGKLPTLSQLISHKALTATDAPVGRTRSITVVLTSSDVAVPGFCSSRCGSHGALSDKFVPYVWVGNSATQCPGQCAWLFHQPIYGPQTPPLVAPNRDVGVDGMIINLATVLAGAVTNPFGNGFYQGHANAPLEAVSACTGMFGSGSYPGYPGHVLVDPTTGASYNAKGLNGRKYLLPAMWDPNTSQCATLTCRGEHGSVRFDFLQKK